MGERALRTLVEGGTFFEGPRWHAGRWWVSDFYRYGVFAVSPDGEVTVHADLTEYCGGHLNDLLVDATGRAYTGNFGFDIMSFAHPASTSLVRVEPDGTSYVEGEDLWFPNAMAIDGDELI